MIVTSDLYIETPDARVELLALQLDDRKVRATLKYIDNDREIVFGMEDLSTSMSKRQILEMALSVMLHDRGHTVDFAHIMPRSVPPPQTQISPPQTAEWLFAAFAPKRTVKAQLGDLQEIFENESSRFGAKRAKRLYWTRVIRSIVPALWQKLKKLGWLGILIDYGRTKLGF
jgi:hypothetical protein